MRALATCAIVVVLCGLIATAQGRPDFSGNWVLDVARSGREPVIWLQRRPVKLIIRQTDDDVTIDTGDGSLFGVPEPVSETPLHYRLHGSVVTIEDRSLGDIPNFKRKISTEALWDSDWRLLTFTTHFSETPKGIKAGNTRVLIFSMTAGDQEMKVERTGYRGTRVDNGTFSGDVPKYMHNGRLEDDLTSAVARRHIHDPGARVHQKPLEGPGDRFAREVGRTVTCRKGGRDQQNRDEESALHGGES